MYTLIKCKDFDVSLSVFPKDAIKAIDMVHVTEFNSFNPNHWDKFSFEPKMT